MTAGPPMAMVLRPRGMPSIPELWMFFGEAAVSNPVVIAERALLPRATTHSLFAARA